MVNKEHFMHRAIELAYETIGQASPNPQVGCVLVREGKIIAGLGALVTTLWPDALWMSAERGSVRASLAHPDGHEVWS